MIWSWTTYMVAPYIILCWILLRPISWSSLIAQFALNYYDNARRRIRNTLSYKHYIAIHRHRESATWKLVLSLRSRNAHFGWHAICVSVVPITIHKSRWMCHTNYTFCVLLVHKIIWMSIFVTTLCTTGTRKVSENRWQANACIDKLIPTDVSLQPFFSNYHKKERAYTRWIKLIVGGWMYIHVYCLPQVKQITSIVRTLISLHTPFCACVDLSFRLTSLLSITKLYIYAKLKKSPKERRMGGQGEVVSE